jgi:hypothetical protein
MAKSLPATPKAVAKKPVAAAPQAAARISAPVAKAPAKTNDDDWTSF